MELKKHWNKVEIKAQKETDPTQKMVEKRGKKSTLHLFHALDSTYV